MNPFSYRWSLYKLIRDRDRDRTQKSYLKKIEEAQRKKDAKKEDIIHEAGEVLGFINDEISYLITQNLRSKTERLFLDFPAIHNISGVLHGDLWEQSRRTGQWYLTNKGITEVREKIRREQKERREKITVWGSLIIGIIGALDSVKFPV